MARVPPKKYAAKADAAKTTKPLPSKPKLPRLKLGGPKKVIIEKEEGDKDTWEEKERERQDIEVEEVGKVFLEETAKAAIAVSKSVEKK